MKSHPPKPGNRFPAPIAIVALLVAAALWLFWRNHRASSDQSVSREKVAQPIAPPSSNPPTPIVSTPPQGFTDAISTARRALTDKDSRPARSTLDALRAELTALPKEAAVRAIRSALDSREDATTGLGFKLASDGSLSEAPTLRTFLLDQLERMDPNEAAAYAEKILNSPDSSDEWAVAMRSYALVRTDAESRTFLQQKFREMIAQDSWRSAPSVGFLEAFDVAVHEGGKELLPDLTTLVRDKENRAVAHAAYLTLDRLTINDPVTTLTELQRQPEAMEGREATRANYFARANVGDPDQRAIIEKYLLDPKLSPAELQTFAGIFPNANYMVSPNLLTKVVTPDHGTLAVRDRLALDTVNQWITDPRFEKLKPQLEKTRQRLDMFVRQASGGAQAAQ